MRAQQTKIEGVVVVKFQRMSDDRGSFERLYCFNELGQFLDGKSIVQVNISKNKKVGTVRGLHYQLPPFAEKKLVYCLQGKIWDVVVDLREGSKTFLKWYSIELGEANGMGIIIPEGCAHGFQVLETNTKVNYFHTSFYNKPSETGIIYNDSLLDIPWPKMIANISDKDLTLPSITERFKGYPYEL